MNGSRPGDVLAGRYRLQDLLNEKRGGRFWRAEDEVLGRSVAIHVLASDDARADALMAAARASATVADPRLLRVLDADQTSEIAYVVNEWGAGLSFDHVLTAEGPLSPDRAAMVATEVAETVANAHARGYAHGRLNPENVLFDDHGSVRIIGFAVEAALHGTTPDRRRDITDLGALLYAGITGKWAGATDSRLDPAPRSHGRLMRARQVRAGVPRALDELCDDVLGDPGRPLDAGEVLSALATFIGEPVDLPRPREAGQHAAGQAGPPTMPTPVTGAAAEQPHQSEQTEQTEQTEPLGRTSAPDDDGDPTEPGLPIFDDDWAKPRTDAPPPPPPPEEEPPKPLFADEVTSPGPGLAPEPAARQAPLWPDTGPQERVSAPPTGPAAPTGTARPWDPAGPAVEVAEEPGKVPGRSWLRLAIAVGVSIVLFICMALAFNWGHGGDQGNTPDASDGSEHRPAASPISGVTANDYDPYGDPPDEYPDLVSRAVDGDPDTTWYTATYNDQIGSGPRSLKPGVGLVLDLAKTYTVDSLTLTTKGSPTGLSLFVLPETPDPTIPPDEQGFRPVVEKTMSGTRTKLTLPQPRKGRYVVIWLTALPAAAGGGYRGEIAEAVVHGSAA